MEQAMITRKPPHYMPEISEELIFGISGHDYLFHYLSEIFENLICNSFGAHSNRAARMSIQSQRQICGN